MCRLISKPVLLRPESASLRIYIQKLEDPAEGKRFLDYVKASKRIGWLVQNAAKKKEIYAAEIFITCWKLVELLDGKIPRGNPNINPNIIKNDDCTLKRLGIDYRVFHLWRRLRNGFTWDALQVEVDQFEEKPTLTGILSHIPFETILVVPTLGRYSIIYPDPPWEYGNIRRVRSFSGMRP